MGLFWDLIQQSQISSQDKRSASLEERVAGVEDELRRTQQLLRAVIERLETHLRTDLDDDGRIG